MKYSYHPSINIIRRYSQRFPSFYISVVDKNTVLKEIRKLRVKKAIQNTDIPVKALKENKEVFAEQTYLQFNEDISASQIPASFKFANITPTFKQDSRSLEDNYRPTSILPVVPKVFEKLMCKQLSNHFDNIFSKFECGFRINFDAKHCLLLMIDK